eukprot:5019728-Pleurochrysis_carterae.AAC.5
MHPMRHCAGHGAAASYPISVVAAAAATDATSNRPSTDCLQYCATRPPHWPTHRAVPGPSCAEKERHKNMTSAATHLRVGSHGQQNQNRVTNVVFFATHTTARDDSRLIRHYSQKMRRDASLHAEAWTLLYEDSGKKEGHGYLDLHAWENYTDARLFVWNEAKLFDLFSALP